MPLPHRGAEASKGSGGIQGERRHPIFMAGAYSADLRERVLMAVEAGEAPEEVAERFMVGRATAYRWVAAARDEGRRTAKPMNGGPEPIIRDDVQAAVPALLEDSQHPD